MATLIFLHHDGQFLLKGTADTKVATIKGKKLYIETVHDLTYSYHPKYREFRNKSRLVCDPFMNFNYDICLKQVRLHEITIYEYKIGNPFMRTFQALDYEYLYVSNYNCTFPFQTQMPSESCHISEFQLNVTDPTYLIKKFGWNFRLYGNDILRPQGLFFNLNCCRYIEKFCQ